MILQRNTTTIFLDDQGGSVNRWQENGKDIFAPRGMVETAQGLKMRGGMHVCFPQHGAAPESGQLSKLSQHGFLRDTVLESSSPGTRYAHEWKADSLQPDYPYTFKYSVEANVIEGGFAYTMSIINTGSEPLPVCPALHPYFAIPHTGTELTLDLGDQKIALPKLGEEVEEIETIVYPLDAANHPVHIAIGIDRVISMETSGGCEQIVVWTDKSSYFCVEPVWGKRELFGSPEGKFIEPGQELKTGCVFRCK